MTHLDLIRSLFGKAFSISRWYIPGHDGIDLAAKRGTPIRAVASGKVSYARDSRTDAHPMEHWAFGGGNVVNIDVGNSLTTQYAHLNDIYVKPGAWVNRGDIIGTVGTTGGFDSAGKSPPGSNFVGAHVHFGLWDHKAGKMVEPTTFLAAALAGWNGPLPKAPDDSAATGDPIYASALKWALAQGITPGSVITDEQWTRFVAYYMQATGQDRGGEVETALNGPLRKAWVGKTWGDIGAHQAVFPDPTTGPLNDIADFLAAVINPANWVRILAIFGGAGLAGFGLYGLMRSTGAPSVAPVGRAVGGIVRGA